MSDDDLAAHKRAADVAMRTRMRDAAVVAGMVDDDGLPRVQRMFALRSGADVLPAGYVVRDVAEVLVFELPLESFNEAPVHFGDFLASKPNARAYHLLFQLINASLERLANQMLAPMASEESNKPRGGGPDPAPGGAGGAAGGGGGIVYQHTTSFPIELMIEPIFQALDYEAEIGSDAQERQFSIDYLCAAFKDPDLMLPNEEDDALINDPALKNMRFMQSTRNRVVLAWRFWYFCHEPSRLLSDMITANLNTVFEFWLQRDKPSEPVAFSLSKQRALKRTAGNAQLADHESTATGQMDMFFELRNSGKLLDAVSIYLSDGTMSSVGGDADRSSRLLNPTRSHTAPDSELNPRHFFGAASLFIRSEKRERIDPLQRNIDAYLAPSFQQRPSPGLQRPGESDVAYFNRIVDGQDWRFPYEDSVVRCRPRHMRLAKLEGMYIPTYQLREIERYFSVITDIVANQRLSKKKKNGAEPPPAPSPPPPPQDLDGEDEMLLGMYDQFREVRANNLANVEADGGLVHIDVDGNERIYSLESVAMLFDANANQRLAANGIIALSRPSMLHRMRDLFLMQKYPLVAQIADKQRRRRALVQLMVGGLDTYLTQCMSSRSDISRIGRVMMADHETRVRTSTNRLRGSYGFRDPKLSFFGNLMVHRFTHVYEEVLCLLTSHSECHLVFTCAKGAYRHAFILHPAVLIYGPPGVSKSKVYEAVRAALTPGTVTMVSSKSTRAEDVDHDSNDVNQFYHEAPEEMLGAGGGAAGHAGGKRTSSGSSPVSESCNQLKTILTECRLERQVLSINQDDPLAPRQTKVIVSEKMQTNCWATNLSKWLINPAVIDRSIAIFQCQRSRGDGVQMSDKQSDEAEIDGDAEKRLARDIAFNDERMLQQIVYHAEKNIMVGSMLDCTLVSMQHVWSTYTKTLSNLYGIELPPRQNLKTMALLRTHVIDLAAAWLYGSPTSPCFGKPFHIYHLMIMAPMLRDNLELSLFVLDMMRDQFHDPLKKGIVGVLRSSVLPAAINASVKQARTKLLGDSRGPIGLAGVEPPLALSIFDTRSQQHAAFGGATSRVTSSGYYAATTSSAPPRGPHNFGGAAGSAAAAAAALGSASFSNDPGAAVLPSGATRTQLGADLTSLIQRSARITQETYASDAPPANDPLTPAQYDTNYINLGPITQLAIDVSGRMSNRSDTLHVTPDTCTAALKSLTDVAIRSRSYKRGPANSLPADPKETQAIVVEDKESELRSFYAAKLVGERHGGHCGDFFLHVSLAFGRFDNEHDVAINSCITEFTEEAHYISALPHQANLPHVLAVRHIQPRRGAYMPWLRNKADRRRGAAEFGTIMTHSLDWMAAKTRLDEMGVDTSDDDTVLRFVDHFDHEAAKELPEAYADEQIQYPEYFLELAKESARRAQGRANMTNDKAETFGMLSDLVRQGRATTTHGDSESLVSSSARVEAARAKRRALLDEIDARKEQQSDASKTGSTAPTSSAAASSSSAPKSAAPQLAVVASTIRQAMVGAKTIAARFRFDDDAADLDVDDKTVDANHTQAFDAPAEPTSFDFMYDVF